MQLAQAWHTGANCDQYPRGDRRLGEAWTERRKAYNRAGKPSARFPTHESQFCGNPSAVACVNDYAVFGARRTPCQARHRRSPMAHDQIAPLTVQEMSALARRFEARAESGLLRDQPQLQSHLRLAPKLIYKFTCHAPAIAG